ncbi:Potassium channel tetramerization domain-containing protein / pentapeptide repeat-containing protein [Hibiscus syriacus]|uniref:Potassium channel tetramerization domain-containing protein / pentapeptide repeat-containing protein n=2 Tax=Hibiscus syriacus TaxID=106335 RepID=A0A6A3C255_HIBSY|nr:Potassium channel tetramerization domain-containing protein / pentapeptide repeat-containing protein [Hibiscus syriacus]
MLERKHLSSIANHVLQRSAEELGSSVDRLVKEFEAKWEPEAGDFSKKLVEFCSLKALINLCQNMKEKMSNGSYSRFTYDMMLAWEKPRAVDEEPRSQEYFGKGKEDRTIRVQEPTEQDDISLFYSDQMPLLVNHDPSVEGDAFVWLSSLVPLAADITNGRFTFEKLTLPTGNHLFFPAYDRFLKEIHNCMKHLQKQAKPNGVELADDEFILHVEGTASSQRVVRHIEGTSWPGRLTLTNYALYFEASGAINYEDALKIDLTRKIDHSVKPAATGPWGAPLFDKAIIYESPDLPGVLLEFPEITSSTRRDHWLALTKEILLMHKFLSDFEVECPIQAWEMHARTILSIIRLHAAREMLRICPPNPISFLIFGLYEELPKGDYVLEQLAQSLKEVDSGQPCSASSILRKLNLPEHIMSSLEVKRVNEVSKTIAVGKDDDDKISLGTAIDQARKEGRGVAKARATVEGLKEEGISESAMILMELLKPLRSVFPWFRDIFSWERPATTVLAFAIITLLVYKEWIGKAICFGLLLVVANMARARQERLKDKQKEIVVYTGSDNNASTRENVVSAQYRFLTLRETIKEANVTILKLHSLLVSRAHKHANTVMLVMIGLAMLFALIPFKYIIIAAVFHSMVTTSLVGKYIGNNQGDRDQNRRLKEWWDSIPPTPIRVINEAPVNPE